MAVVGLLLADPAVCQLVGPTSPVTLRPLIFFSNTDGVMSFTETGEELLMADSTLVTDWSVQAEYRFRSFALLADASFSRTANEVAWLPDTTRGGTYDFRALTVEAFAALRIGPGLERVEVLAFMGGRYYDLRLNLAGMGPEGQRTDHWLGPTVGVRTTVGFLAGARWWAQPDFSFRIGRQVIVWGLRSGMDFRIVGPIGATIQYMFREYDFQIQSDEEFNFGGTTQGWLLGLVAEW